MKANYYAYLFSLTMIFLAVSQEAFSSTHINKIFANQNFQVTQQSDTWDIAFDKNPWESFTIAIPSDEIMKNPVVILDVLSNEKINLRIDLTDGVFMSSENKVVQKQINCVKTFSTISFDFTDLIKGVDLSNDVYLVFYINPGQNYQGKISIKNFKLSDQIPEQSVNPTRCDQSLKIFPSPATTFTNVEIPEGNFTTLTIVDLNGNIVLQNNVSFYYGSTYRIELSDLPSGYYTVQLTDGNNTLSQKLIIN